MTSIPKGYQEIHIAVQEFHKVDSVVTLSCNRCGAMVMFPQKHDNWHKGISLTIKNG